MAVRNASDVEKTCSKIYSECASLVTWKGDDRFQAVLSEFPAGQEEEVISVLEKYFGTCWDEETIDYAPGKVRSVVRGLAKYARGSDFFAVTRNRMRFCLGLSGPGIMVRKFP